jgi:hypothetical protein
VYNVSCIVRVALCAVFYLNVVCYLMRYMYFCVLCLIVVPLPPVKTHLQFNYIIIIKYSKSRIIGTNEGKAYQESTISFGGCETNFRA